MPQSDFLFLPTAARSGVWVQLVSNTTSTPYVSTAATDANGMFTHSAPTDALGYTVNIGPSGTGPWTFSGDANYFLPGGAGGFTNPMTTLDDVIVGAASGVAARLAKGASAAVLTVDPTSGHVAWDLPNSVTPNAETSTLLGVGGVIHGVKYDTGASLSPYRYFRAFAASSVASASLGFVIEQSDDNGTTWFVTNSFTVGAGTLTGSVWTGGTILEDRIVKRYVRASYTNGGTTQVGGAFNFSTALVT